ncbi:unnamed protein product [Cladocopium goreaui]|uniref:Secreted protein n=1 Tax=Cladocopium goreaui TaxID=2562237 RepID=A0A9P1CH88_9DINO|nr:unnamed protein product [Cladocopium goreaui]
MSTWHHWCSMRSLPHALLLTCKSHVFMWRSWTCWSASSPPCLRGGWIPCRPPSRRCATAWALAPQKALRRSSPRTGRIVCCSG